MLVAIKANISAIVINDLSRKFLIQSKFEVKRNVMDNLFVAIPFHFNNLLRLKIEIQWNEMKSCPHRFGVTNNVMYRVTPFIEIFLYIYIYNVCSDKYTNSKRLALFVSGDCKLFSCMNAHTKQSTNKYINIYIYTETISN